MADLFKVFTAGLQFLKGLYDSFRHTIVRFRRATNDRELFTGRDSLVPIGIIEADSQ